MKNKHGETFVVADLHLGHHGVCKFLTNEGTKLRPWETIEEMDEALVDNWNKTVTRNDKVYVLGDVVINRRALETIGRLNGSKVLVKGNHDIFRLNEYTKYFYDIRAYHIIHNVVLSHIPIHEENQARFEGNIHGHLHSNRVLKDGKIDPWYLCVSVEHTNFKPTPLMEAIKTLKGQEGYKIKERTSGGVG